MNFILLIPLVFFSSSSSFSRASAPTLIFNLFSPLLRPPPQPWSLYHLPVYRLTKLSRHRRASTRPLAKSIFNCESGSRLVEQFTSRLRSSYIRRPSAISVPLHPSSAAASRKHTRCSSFLILLCAVVCRVKPNH